MKLKKGVKKAIFYVVESIFLILIIFSTVKIINWWSSSKKSEKLLNEIQEAITIDEDIEEPTEKYKVDFEKLKEQNKDTIAWLKVYDTKIEYPVVKASNNNYYLTHSFDRSSSVFGWVFANYQNKFDGTDKNITIFAHGMINGSMFGTLKETLKEDWQKNDNPIILVTEDGTSLYKVFSTYKIKDEALFFKSSFKDNEFEEFINTILERSNHDYEVEVTKDDQILTLATCDTDDHYRLILHAKKIILE